MKRPNDYIEDLLVRIAHHSTAIEGNTLTQGETKSILIDQYIPRPMSMNELYEVQNYRQFMIYLLDSYTKPITPQTIKDIHKLLTEHLVTTPGKYKTIRNIVIGADFTPVEPYEVPLAIQRWCDDLAYRLAFNRTLEDKVLTIMEQHLKFEHIHPFSDGNGRTGRALIVYACLNQGIEPIIIEKEQRKDYINLLNTEDIKGLQAIGVKLVTKEEGRRKIFIDRENKSL